MVVDSVLRGGRPPGSSLVPFGRQMEVSGPENSGKTTLCAQIAAETQSKGGVVVAVDTEERIDVPYWTLLGVNVSRILRIAADSVNDVFNKQYTALKLLRDKFPDRLVLMIWDSLGGTRPIDVIDMNARGQDKKILTPMEQAEKYGMRQAREISIGMELINGVVSGTRACYLYTNHEYTKIGVTYGDTRETRGGMKPKYFATVRLRLTPVGQVKEDDNIGVGSGSSIGQKVQVRALKNSMAGILHTREAVVMAGKGFVNEYTVFEWGQKLGLIAKNGSWYMWKPSNGKERKFQGFNGFMEEVGKTPEYEELFVAVSNAM
jgi:RecA/RadA recombinase